MEMSDSKTKDDPGPSRSKSPELREEIKKLKEEIDKLQRENDLEKRARNQMEVQVQELKEKLNNNKCMAKIKNCSGFSKVDGFR
jgi:hypothetical protein